MTKPELHVVEGGRMDKSQALAAALAQIDKLHGKGSIMRLGANDKPSTSRRSRPARSASTSRSASAALPSGRVVEIYGPESSGKTTLALHVDRRGAEERAASAPSSTPSMRSTPAMPASSASRPTTCWSRSPTPASRRSRSPTCWCAPAPSTSSSSTRSPR